MQSPAIISFNGSGTAVFTGATALLTLVIIFCLCSAHY
jgi:hypothetical protein